MDMRSTLHTGRAPPVRGVVAAPDVMYGTPPRPAGGPVGRFLLRSA